jgi:ribonuclease P protein component
MQRPTHTFKSKERLKSRKQIASLFETGKIIHAYPYKGLYKISLQENEFPAQFAVSVSKKNFKRAVDRNRIKRKIRETYRLQKQELYQVLNEFDQNIVLFVIYTAKQEVEFQTIQKGMQMLIRKLTEELNS